MATYSELELRYVRPVARAILEDSTFRRWLLAGTRLGDAIVPACPVDREVQASLRSPTMKNEYWFNYWCALAASEQGSKQTFFSSWAAPTAGALPSTWKSSGRA